MKRDRQREEEQARMLWRLSAMGGELAFGIVGMVLLGLGVDYIFKSIAPWGVVTGAVLGVIGSGYNFIRQAVMLNKRAALGGRTGGAGHTGRPPTRPGDAPEPEKKSQEEDTDDDLRFPPDFDKY